MALYALDAEARGMAEHEVDRVLRGHEPPARASSHRPRERHERREAPSRAASPDEDIPPTTSDT